MNKAIIFMAFSLFAGQSLASDSVYSWGTWSQGIKPAAGPARITPPPAQKPDVSFRPNEHSNLTRSIATVQTPAPVPTPVVTVPDIAASGVGDITPGASLTAATRPTQPNF